MNRIVETGAHATIAGSHVFNAYFSAMHGTAQGSRRENEDLAKIVPSLGFCDYLSSGGYDDKVAAVKNVLAHGPLHWDTQIERKAKDVKTETKSEDKIVDQDRRDLYSRFSSPYESMYFGDNARAIRSDIMYFAVLDGHGGKKCAKFINWLLPHMLQMYIVEVFDSLTQDQIVSRIKSICQIADNLWMQTYPKDDSGTTLVMALVYPTPSGYKGYFAHVGDSRIIVLDSSNNAMYMSTDHTTALESEQDRVTAAGGYFYKSKGTHRTQGLGMSRAFGDQNLKDKICKEKSAIYEAAKDKVKQNYDHLKQLTGQDYVHAANAQLEQLYAEFHEGRNKFSKDQPISCEPDVVVLEGFSRILMFTDGMIENKITNEDLIKRFSIVPTFEKNISEFCQAVTKEIYQDPEHVQDNRTVLLADFHPNIQLETKLDYTITDEKVNRDRKIPEKDLGLYRVNPSTKTPFVDFGPFSTMMFPVLAEFLADFSMEHRKSSTKSLSKFLLDMSKIEFNVIESKESRKYMNFSDPVVCDQIADVFSHMVSRAHKFEMQPKIILYTNEFV